MLAAELIGKTKQELKDLLLLNTQQYRFDDAIIGASFPVIYDSFIESESVLIEKQIFWEMVLQSLFAFDEEIVSAFVKELGSFGFIALCEEHLSHKQEVQVFTKMYESHHTKEASLTTLLSKVFNAFFEDVSNIQPEEINKIISELKINLNELPDFIKNAVK